MQKLCAAWTQPKQPAAVTSSSPATVSAAVPAPRGRGRPKKIVGGAEMGGVSVGTPLLPIQSPISSLFMAIKMFTVGGGLVGQFAPGEPERFSVLCYRCKVELPGELC